MIETEKEIEAETGKETESVTENEIEKRFPHPHLLAVVETSTAAAAVIAMKVVQIDETSTTDHPLPLLHLPHP